MKKRLSIILVFILLMSGVGAATIQYSENTETYQSLTKTIDFPTVSVTETTDEYVKIQMDDLESNILMPGKPVLPKKIIQYQLPFGVTDISIDITPGAIKEKSISKQIIPAPAILSFSKTNNRPFQPVKDPDVYQSTELYPHELYMYDVTSGMNEYGDHLTFVTIHLYPVRYQPAGNRLHFLQKADIKLSYQESDSQPFPQQSEYDLAIIAPSLFTDELTAFVDHKNNMGVETFVKTTEEIYNEYDGVDKPEQIKYFIKDAVETQGVSYVLLVGGMDSMIAGVSRDDKNQGSKDWYVPVRYTNLDVGSYDDPGFISDLYYADLYKEE
ncbi:MAG TPA: C25 family cysteine peptidase, partial [Candidatus Thermoplasmatota archaeon]|nr:C25 family cysteine peptidase [Candidatus Thermoplasmatota archaeon]